MLLYLALRTVKSKLSQCSVKKNVIMLYHPFNIVCHRVCAFFMYGIVF